MHETIKLIEGTQAKHSLVFPLGQSPKATEMKTKSKWDLNNSAAFPQQKRHHNK